MAIVVPKHLECFVIYIKNTGQSPLKIEWFDEDWDPIGPKVRKEMLAAGITEEALGGIVLKLELT